MNDAIPIAVFAGALAFLGFSAWHEQNRADDLDATLSKERQAVAGNLGACERKAQGLQTRLDATPKQVVGKNGKTIDACANVKALLERATGASLK